MNIEFWITLAVNIAMLIATSLNPFVQVWYQNRSNKRIAASPDKNQPKARIEPPLARWLLRVSPLVFTSIGIGVSVRMLIKELQNQEPINRLTIVILAFSIMSIFSLLGVLFVTDLMARFILALQKSQALTGKTIDYYGELIDLLKATPQKPKPRKRDLLD